MKRLSWIVIDGFKQITAFMHARPAVSFPVRFTVRR